MLNIVVNAAFAFALVEAVPSDHHDDFVPNKLRGISSSVGLAGLAGESAKAPHRALLGESERATPQVEKVEVGVPRENVLRNINLASDTGKKIPSGFDPSAELGHLENSVLQDNVLGNVNPAFDILLTVTPASDIIEKIPLGFDPLEELGDLENTVVHGTAPGHALTVGTGFDAKEDFSLQEKHQVAMYLMDSIGNEPASAWVLPGESEIFADYEDSTLWHEGALSGNSNFYTSKATKNLTDEAHKVEALAENTPSDETSMARDLGKEVYNSNSCGGNYPVINVSGYDFRNLVLDCKAGSTDCRSSSDEDCFDNSSACTSPYNEVPLGCWETSRVTDMYKAFYFSSSFNDDISFWNTAKVTNMAKMFQEAVFFNQDISYWDVSAVTDMKKMFEYTYNFNQPIGVWDVANVIDMSKMFYYAREFNQPIGVWDVANVTDMFKMLSSTRDFNRPLDQWDVANVTSMSRMFEGARTFNQPLGNWDVGKVVNMDRMFKYAGAFNQCLSSWGKKVPDDVDTYFMFVYTDCSGSSTPQPDTTQWCQTIEDGCPAISLSCNIFTSLSQDCLSILCNEEEFTTNCPELCPTSVPTSSPTSEPVIDCENKSETFKIDVDGTLKTKDCDWVVSKKKSKQRDYCKMKVEINGKKKKLPTICKKTCGDLGKGECAFLKDS